MKAVTHLEKVIAGETSAVTHLEKVIAQETTAVTYTEKVIAGTAPPVTHLQKVIAGVANPVTHLEYVWAGGSPPSVQEYTGAVPVTFVADGTPLLDYIISGNTVQNGTPTPDSPITPQGTGERTGNLFDKGLLVDAKGIFLDGSVVDDSNRTCTVNAISVSDSSYALSWTSDDVLAITATYNNGTLVNRVASLASPTVIDTTGANELRVAFYKTNVQITKNDVSNIMLNIGSTALPYEPYGYKIPISSAGQITPVYPGEVQTTRKIKKLVLTGDSTYDYRKNSADNSNYLYYTLMSDNSVGARICTCSHLPFSASGAPTNSVGCNARTQNVIYINFGADIMNAQTSGNTVAGLNEYLAAQYAAGTPVTIWYVLAEPETSIVNEPLMKIGDYADTLSMEQAGVSIPTANGSTTLDVETTAKPSEVYIKYRGEAVATLSTLSAEVSSPEANEEVNPEETEEEENGSEDVSLQYKPEAIE